VLLDPYRPGVLEKAGLGPGDVMRGNPKLVYARITGYGQDGPLAMRAGHDLNYLAHCGLLDVCPIPPSVIAGSLLARHDHMGSLPINGGACCRYWGEGTSRPRRRGTCWPTLREV
jgi:crotonobetainyl-CoA:carnitine CoA-transferase CaiB-like acyl-CoA transferase